MEANSSTSPIVDEKNELNRCRVIRDASKGGTALILQDSGA